MSQPFAPLLPATSAGRVPWWRRERVVAGSLLLLLTLLCLGILRDFALSTDEPQQRLIGLVSLKYVAGRFFPDYLAHHAEIQSVYNLRTFWDRDYGVALELPVAWLEQALALREWTHIYWLHHLCTLAVALGGVVAMYQLARRRFGSWPLGLLGAAMLVLSPRLFADFFYNSKDLVFMAVLAIATNTAVRLVLQPSWQRAAVHALACALAIDVRIMGLLVPAATLALLAWQTARGAYPRRGRVAAQAGLYLGLLLTLMVLAWPYLWDDPLRNFGLALYNVTQARWRGEVFFAGQMWSVLHLPWYYAPTWIGITTPLLYLLGFGVGVAAIGRQLLRRGWGLYATAAEWQDLLFLGLVLLPLGAVIATHSVLYNGWRQLYFVYPPLLLVALRGLVALGRWRPATGWLARWWPRLRYAALAAALLTAAGQLVALHPLQNTYFNVLAGAHVESRFEIDYWTLSYRDGLAWIAAHDPRPHIVVAAQRPDEAESNRKMLNAFDRDRLEVTGDAAKGDYFLTTYYGHPEPYPEFAFELWQLQRGGNRVLSVFRTRWEPAP